MEAIRAESATKSARIQARANYRPRKLTVNIRACTHGERGVGLIGPIRGNSWRLLISLSLRLRVAWPQCYANCRPTETWISSPGQREGAVHLSRSRSMSIDARGSPIRVFARHRLSPPRWIVREEEFVIWKCRAASDLHFVEHGRRRRKR